MRMTAACMLALIFASGVTARAETDVFMRAVGFALTGSDVADPKVIGDRAHHQERHIPPEQCSHRPHHNPRMATATGIGAMGYGRTTWRRCRI